MVSVATGECCSWRYALSPARCTLNACAASVEPGTNDA